MGKKKKTSLFVKVLIAIACGALLGLGCEFLLNKFAEESFLFGFATVLIRILKTFNVLFAQILKFIVPLLVLGLVTPAIANLGKGAGKMLLFVVVVSYVSTICAGFFSYGCASAFLPHIIKFGDIDAAAMSMRTFAPFIELKIPPLCDIMTALVLSFMLGIGTIVINAGALKRGFDEFGNIVKITIEGVIIPCLPVYIFTMVCEMSAKGVLGSLVGAGAKVIATGVVLSIVFLFIQYLIACAIAKKNPFKCLYNMLPAYLTGFSICSSSAVIPVTQECTLKNGVSEDIASFTVPLCSTVHMCGSTIKLATTTVAVALLGGLNIPFALYVNFVLMQGVAAVAAPGVMGGVLMASVGLLESILGFTPEQTALMMAIYLAFDGYGPACNVTGDGAIALVVDKFFGKKK